MEQTISCVRNGGEGFPPWHQFFFGGGGNLCMREMGTMWHIGVLRKPWMFLLQDGSFSAFSCQKKTKGRERERVSSGFDVELRIPLLALTPPGSGFLLEFVA